MSPGTGPTVIPLAFGPVFDNGASADATFTWPTIDPTAARRVMTLWYSPPQPPAVVVYRGGWTRWAKLVGTGAAGPASPYNLALPPLYSRKSTTWVQATGYDSDGHILEEVQVPITFGGVPGACPITVPGTLNVTATWNSYGFGPAAVSGTLTGGFPLCTWTGGLLGGPYAINATLTLQSGPNRWQLVMVETLFSATGTANKLSGNTPVGAWPDADFFATGIAVA